MLPHDVAAELEQFAIDVERIRGASHRNPEAFVEDKSEVVHKMRLRAKELRTGPRERKPLPVLHPGTVPIGRREVRVEVRGRRRA